MQDTSRAPRPAGPVPPETRFDRSPLLVIWETTQACDLACLHCRADARPHRDREELSGREARALMDRVRAFGRPLMVLTGGDPAKRPDLVELVAYGADLGLRMALTPSGTPLMTPATVGRLAEAGLSRLAMSLDGSTPAVHDSFRGVAGSWGWTVDVLRAAGQAGLSTQINTTVTCYNLDDLEAIAERAEALEIDLWSVFFLVPTGRAALEDVVSPEQFEQVFHRMYDISLRSSFDVKSTAAPQYRRVVLQRRKAERRAGGRRPRPGDVGFALPAGGRPVGVNDGNGFVFVSHTGEIYPSGFFPLRAGNVRVDDLVEVYREHDLFRALRDADRLKGKCGVCEYREVCGGGRARAWALTGDPFEADPFCIHVPARYRRMVEAGEAEDVDAYFEARIPGWPPWSSEWDEGRAPRRIALPMLRRRCGPAETRP